MYHPLFYLIYLNKGNLLIKFCSNVRLTENLLTEFQIVSKSFPSYSQGYRRKERKKANITLLSLRVPLLNQLDIVRRREKKEEKNEVL